MQTWNLQNLMYILLVDTGVCSLGFQYPENQKVTIW